MNTPKILTCAACGAADFAAPEKATNSSMVACRSCGAQLATVAELQAAAKSALAAAGNKVSKDKFREAFKNLKNIKVD
jgi:transcription elongation factor Elf1